MGRGPVLKKVVERVRHGEGRKDEEKANRESGKSESSPPTVQTRCRMCSNGSLSLHVARTELHNSGTITRLSVLASITSMKIGAGSKPMLGIGHRSMSAQFKIV